MAYNYGLFPQPTGCAIVDLAIDTSSTDMNKNPGPKSLKQQIFSVCLFCTIKSLLVYYLGTVALKNLVLLLLVIEQ